MFTFVHQMRTHSIDKKLISVQPRFQSKCQIKKKPSFIYSFVYFAQSFAHKRVEFLSEELSISFIDQNQNSRSPEKREKLKVENYRIYIESHCSSVSLNSASNCRKASL